MDIKEIWNLSETLANNQFKDYKFINWNSGLSSTERRNLSRVKKLLNVLDELNRNNIKDESLFYFVAQLIKEVLKKQYEIKASGNTYSIKRLKP